MPDPFRVFLRGLPEDIDRAREAGLPVVLDVAEPLPVHAQRLMDTLDVEVHVVTATAANGLVTTCPVKSCSWTFVGDDEKAKPFVESHLRLMHGVHRHRPVLEEREPKADEASDSFAPPPATGQGVRSASDAVASQPRGGVSGAAASRSSSTNRAQWTRQRIIDAVRRWAIDHDGLPPTKRDWLKTAPDHPNAYVVVTTFASWADAIEAAGYGRPTRGTRRRDSSSEGAATASSARGHARPVDERGLDDEQPAMRAPTPAATADGSGEPEPGPAPDPVAVRDLTAVRAAAHQLVDAIFEALA